jgi:hypothetical protein
MEKVKLLHWSGMCNFFAIDNGSHDIYRGY